MKPVIESDWIRPGTHVIAVGSCRLTHVEVAPQLVARSRLYVDSRAAALQESGDVAGGLAAGGAIFAELGEVVAGVAGGRQSDTEVTMFKSLGLAVEDVVAANLIYRGAVSDELLAHTS
jgi:ornithine cyclodeaminase/alanine dehydrogenase-like protein (mu-crystallin family)